MATSSPDPEAELLKKLAASAASVSGAALEKFNRPEVRAVHEAAHAVLGARAGYTLFGMCLCSEDSDHTWMAPPDPPPPVEEMLVVTVAGDAAEVGLAGVAASDLSYTDDADARSILGLDPGVDDRRIVDAMDEAGRQVAEDAEVVRSLAVELVERREMTGQEVLEVLHSLDPTFDAPTRILDRDCCHNAEPSPPA